MAVARWAGPSGWYLGPALVVEWAMVHAVAPGQASDLRELMCTWRCACAHQPLIVAVVDRVEYHAVPSRAADIVLRRDSWMPADLAADPPTGYVNLEASEKSDLG